MNKLMKLNDNLYRIACHCMARNCEIDLFVDPFCDNLWEIYMQGTVRSYYKGSNFFKSIWWRIKTALIILFKGYIEMEGGIILDQENTESLIYVLNKFKNKKEAKNE